MHVILKVSKKCQYDPKRFFPNIFNMGIKNSKFDANFGSVEKEKVEKKFTVRKLEGWKLLYTVLKRWKSTWFLHFYANNFFVWNFLHFFQRICNQHQILCFWHPYQNVVKKIFLGSYWRFFQLWSLTCATWQKTEISFSRQKSAML